MGRSIGEEKVKKIVEMGEQGKRISDIVNATGVSDYTVGRYLKMYGIKPASGNGGLVSKTIQLNPIECKREDSIKEEATDVIENTVKPSPVIVMEQSVQAKGEATGSVYRILSSKSSISIDGEIVVGEIEIEDIPKFVEELKKIYTMANYLKSGGI